MAEYRITPRAQDDLKNIGRYTKIQWGKSQRDTYLRSLEKHFNWLAEKPHLGKHRMDIADGYYSFPEGQHVIFYLQYKTYLDIIGIPHKEMDVISYFKPH